MVSNSEIPINIGDVLQFFRRGLLFSLLTALLAAAAVFYIGRAATPRYQARATLLVAEPTSSYRDSGIITPPPVDPNVYRTAVIDGPVLPEAQLILERENIPLASRQNLAKNIQVTTDNYEVSSLVHIAVTDASATVAARVANAVTTALLSWDQNRTRQNAEAITAALEQEVDALNAQLEALGAPPDSSNPETYDALLARRDDRLADLGTVGIQGSLAVIGLLELFNPASVPATPVATKTVFNTALAFFLGLVFGYGVVGLRTASDTRIRSSDELARVTGLPMMAEFPRRISRGDQLSQEAASYLRTNVLFASAEVQPKIIMVTSAQTAAEKGGLALSLAESFARSERRTLLVDADLRRPITGRTYNLDAAQNASLQLQLQSPGEDYYPASISMSKGRTLDVIPSFTPTQAPVELLSQGFAPLLNKWKSTYDVIVINATPLLPVADALVIAPLCTGIILSASLRSSSYRQVRRAVNLLQRLDTRIIGVVATEVVHGREKTQQYRYSAGKIGRGG